MIKYQCLDVSVSNGNSSINNQSQIIAIFRNFFRPLDSIDLKLLCMWIYGRFCFIAEYCMSVLEYTLYLYIYALIFSSFSCYRVDFLWRKTKKEQQKEQKSHQWLWLYLYVYRCAWIFLETWCLVPLCRFMPLFR